MLKEFKIVHLTSLHTRYDVRIFIKICRSLAKNYKYNISLLVADGEGDEDRDGVKIIDVGKRNRNKLIRFILTSNRIYRKAKNLNADIYHVHDPELMPIALKLKERGAKVIFDAHEDSPKQLLTKPYLRFPLNIIVSRIFEFYEGFVLKKFDAIIAATPSIKSKIELLNSNCIDINNYPIINELSNSSKLKITQSVFCYVGAISKIRGIREIIRALECVEDVSLIIAGNFNNKSLEEEVTSFLGWKKVKWLGLVKRDKISKIMNKSVAGLVLFHPSPNHMESQPNKLFEYMSAELPVIASNFPLWKDLIESNNCGICVNPNNPEEIADALKFLISNPDIGSKMGLNGKKVVLEHFNWSKEESKLFELYNTLLA